MEERDNNNRPGPNQNHHLGYLILAVLAILIPILIPSGILAYWIMQPCVVYERLPAIPIAENESSTTENESRTTKQPPSLRSVTCVIVKNTGHTPASDVFVTIKSENFFPDRTGLYPKIWEYIAIERKSNQNEKVYNLDKFAGGANFSISITAPEEEPKIDIYGIHDAGKKIEMEKSSSLVVILIGLGLYSLGLSTCFLVTKFLIPLIQRSPRSSKKD